MCFVFAGREDTKKRGDGDVCYDAHNHVLCHVGSANPKGDILVIFSHCYLQILLTFLLLPPSPKTINMRRKGDVLCLPEDHGRFKQPQYT